MEAWQDFSDEIDEVIDVGGPVVAAVTVKGRGGRAEWTSASASST